MIPLKPYFSTNFYRTIMKGYNLNLMALCGISIVSLLCSCYMCYSNAVSSESDTHTIVLSIICACCSLYGLCLAMALDRENSTLSMIDLHMDRVPSYNKRVLIRSRSLDTINP